jgi:hypothetical protein
MAAAEATPIEKLSSPISWRDRTARAIDERLAGEYGENVLCDRRHTRFILCRKFGRWPHEAAMNAAFRAVSAGGR